MSATRVSQIPESDFGKPEEHLRRTIQAVNQLQKGQGNNHDFCTLVPNEIETRCFKRNANTGGVAVLSPMSATAATAVAAGVIWVEVVRQFVVIHHNSKTDTDRKFGIVLYG